MGARRHERHPRKCLTDLAGAAAPQGCLDAGQRVCLAQPGRVLRINCRPQAGVGFIALLAMVRLCETLVSTRPICTVLIFGQMEAPFWLV